MKKTSSIFISYSSKDKKFVSRLTAAFEKHGIDFWQDEHKIRPGRDYYDAIEKGLKEADRFMIVLSGNSIKSRWVTRELKAALAREEKEDREIIIPVLLEKVDLPLFIQSKDYSDFTSDEKFDEELRNLLEALGVEFEEQVEDDDIADKLYPNFFLPELNFFVGRTALLEEIRKTLQAQHRVVMHDISGLGKSFTSYKYIRKNHGNYEKIFFVRATKEEWLESLARCGEIVNPELANVTEQMVKAKGFKEWLEKNDGWLVLYDNADLPSELRPFVPVNLRGDCIFTSNFRGSTRLGTDVSIRKLDESDAGILLYSRAVNKPYSTPVFNDPGEREAFGRLLEEIDGLPVTLNSTGAVIYEKDWTFERFWKKYEQTPEIAWDSEDEFSDYQNKSAGKVFSLAYTELIQMKDIGDAVKIVLDSMSFISPDEIPEDLLQEILRTQDESFAGTEEQDDLWDNVREKLTAYDLLKYDKNKKTFTTHRAIQRVIQSRLKGREKDICAALASVLRGLFPLYDYSNREDCEKYYQHVIIMLENADRFGAETGDTNELYFRLGGYQNLLGNYAPAEKFHLRAVEISASVFGKESETHSRNLNDLALVYRLQGRYDEAMEKNEESLRIAEVTIGREHPDYATRLNNLASVYYFQERYDEAIEKYEEALRIGEKTIGRNHPIYARRLNNLALVYMDQGRYDEAIEIYEEALRIDEKTVGPEHPSYAIRITNLASVYQFQGRYDEAVEKLEEALRIGGKTIGPAHPDYATRLNNLANVYQAQGEFRKALDLYNNALQILEKTLPEGHPYIGTLRESMERCGKLVD